MGRGCVNPTHWLFLALTVGSITNQAQGLCINAQAGRSSLPPSACTFRQFLSPSESHARDLKPSLPSSESHMLPLFHRDRQVFCDNKLITQTYYVLGKLC